MGSSAGFCLYWSFALLHSLLCYWFFFVLRIRCFLGFASSLLLSASEGDAVASAPAVSVASVSDSAPAGWFPLWRYPASSSFLANVVRLVAPFGLSVGIGRGRIPMLRAYFWHVSFQLAQYFYPFPFRRVIHVEIRPYFHCGFLSIARGLCV